MFPCVHHIEMLAKMEAREYNRDVKKFHTKQIQFLVVRWGMDSKKLRLLLRAVEAGSMMKIAEDEGYTPSGLTHMMTALEQELGIKLLRRSNQGVALTCEGEELLPFLRRYIAAEDKIRSEIARINTQYDSVIRIGAYASIAKHWIPEIMREYQERHPEVTFDLATFIRPAAYAALEAGRRDIIFAGDERGVNFPFTLLKEDVYYAVIPPSLAEHVTNDIFAIKDLEKFPFIMPAYNSDTAIQQMLASHNVAPKSLAVVADYQVIINMVSNGLGISVLSDLVLTGNRGGVYTLPLSPRLFRRLGIATRPKKELSAVKRDFVEFVCNRFL